MVRNAKSTAFAAVSGYSLRTLKIQVRDVRGDVAPVRTHIRSRSPRIGSEDRGVSGWTGSGCGRCRAWSMLLRTGTDKGNPTV
ncbi:unnamed protein product [Parnassius mnemosyne]|uniref:Uncharacterized protein n=1 Tax=Parnassius mnemosyne TaxID=213953 RepID=A0AAV1LYA4_9NEOP